MNIQVITLPTAIERHQKIKKTFGDNKLTFEFKNGVDINECEFIKTGNNFYIKYKDVNMLINEEKTLHNINRSWIRFGEIAAYLAHYILWKEFLNSKEDKLIVCEDDASPQSDMSFLNHLDYTGIKFINLQTVTAHNQEKQVLYREPFVKRVDQNFVLYQKNLPLLCEGLAAYLITKDGAHTLCQYIEENGFVGPNDCLITKLGQSGVLPIHSPIELNKCFGLDIDTYQYSYTHSGSFKVYKQFNNLVLHIKE
jgi:GR25 family glycosyltransferase involved in LPS biosynthesis